MEQAQEQVQQKTARYSGFVNKHQLKIIVHSDHSLETAHTYTHNMTPILDVSWHFNSKGRIQKVLMQRILEDNNTLPEDIITLPRNDNAWISATAYYASLPKETKFMNINFENHSFLGKYHQVLYYGHSILHSLKKHLSEQFIVQPSFSTHPESQAKTWSRLEKITFNNEALALINRGASLYPHITPGSQKGNFIINYVLYEKS